MVKKSVKKNSAENSKAENVFVLIALILLNIIFVVEFLLGAVGIIIGFFLASFGMIVAGLVGLAISSAYPLVMNSWISNYIFLGGIHPVAIALLSLAVLCFGFLWMIGTCYIVKYFVKGMKWYFDLNVRVFKKYEH